MGKGKNGSLINCIATTLIAYFITVPGHELLHLLTHMAYGSKLLYYSAGAVDATVADYSVLSPFHRIMVAGGSASILNVIFALILVLVLMKAKNLKAMTRLFLIQLAGMQAVQGIGYFLIGGVFAVGDWGNVFERISDLPGLVTALRIILSVTGSAGIVALFFFLNYQSYYFIEHKDDKKERRYVAFRLHGIVLIIGFALGMIVSALSPAMKDGSLNWSICILFNFMWIPFLWGWLYTGYLVKPPKEGRFLYPLPEKPSWILFAVGVVLILIDIFVFGPGIRLG